MVSNKLFITSLLAAAAMSAAPAWAAISDLSVSGTADGTTAITVGSGTVNASNNTYTIAATADTQYTIGALSISDGVTVTITRSGPLNVAFGGGTILSGSGAIELSRTNTGDLVGSIYKIESGANLSEFTGTIKISNATGGFNAALYLVGSAEKATVNLASGGAGLVISGTNVSIAGLDGASTALVRSQAEVAYNDTSGNNFSNRSSTYNNDNDNTVRTLTIGGSGTYSFAGSVGSATNQTSLNLTKSGTGTQTFSGTTYLGNLEVSNGELIFSGASDTSKGTASVAGTLTTSGSGVVKVLEYGILDLSEATVSLTSAIQNSGQVTISESTVFNITEAGSAVTLITGTGTISDTGVAWSNLTKSNFTYNGVQLNGRSTLDLSTSGTATLSYVAAKTLTWNGSASDTWSEATVGTEPSSTPWRDESDADDAFYAGDSVNFSKDETAAVTVAESGVLANTVTISAGTVSFTGGTITATGGISVTGGTLAVAEAAPLGTNVISLSGGTLQAGATLTLANAVNVSAASGIDTNGNGLTLTGPLSGSGTLTKVGEGALTISGTSADFAGVVNVSAGTLKFGASDVDLLGSRTEDVSRIVVGANGVLDLNGQKGLSYKVELAGGKLVNNGSSLTGGNVQFREIVLSADSEVSGSGNFGVVASGTTPTKIDLQGYTLTKKDNNVFLMTTTTITAGTVKIEAGEVRAGNYDGQGGPIDASAADFVLSSNTAILGANNKAFSVKSLSGVSGSKVSLDSGTLKIGEVVADSTVSHTFSGMITGSGKVVKAGAGTLVLDGANTYTGGTTISGGKLVAANTSALGSGLVTVASGAELGLVAGATVTVADGIELASGAKIVIDMTGVTAGTEEEVVLTLVSATALNYNETGTFDTAGMLGSVVVLENLSETLSTWTQSLSYSGNTLSLTMTIPEPSVFGLLAGLGALALAGSRRRRRKA
ncbi:MAG: beta strand repeat-containing protein [Candidatus Spyradosoma sp.]